MAGKPWAGQTVVCIASGPSLTAEDCEAVRRTGMPAIAVNSSWKAAPFAHVVYGGDLAWWDAYGREIDTPAEKWTCTRQAAQRHGINLHVAHGPYNSGMRAIQFAIERGAARILLLGYDCTLAFGVHWHGAHEATGNPDEARVKMWHRQFASVAALAQAARCEVVNCSRHTELRAFPRGDLAEQLAATKPAVSVPVLVQGMHGLGDGIYQRAFLRNLPGAYVETPWPELYADLDVKPVRPSSL